MRNKPLPGFVGTIVTANTTGSSKEQKLSSYVFNKPVFGKHKEISNIQATTDFLTKKHTIYKNKNLTLRGQVNAPNLSLGWNPKGSLTKYGGPTLSLSNSANLSGNLKLSKSTTLSGGVSYRSGNKPSYTFGLNIRL